MINTKEFDESMRIEMNHCIFNAEKKYGDSFYLLKMGCLYGGDVIRTCINIIALWEFLEKNPTLQEGYIIMFIKNYSKYYGVLRDLIEVMPNALEELRENGFKKVIKMYLRQCKANKEINEGITK